MSENSGKITILCHSLDNNMKLSAQTQKITGTGSKKLLSNFWNLVFAGT